MQEFLSILENIRGIYYPQGKAEWGRVLSICNRTRRFDRDLTILLRNEEHFLCVKGICYMERFRARGDCDLA